MKIRSDFVSNSSSSSFIFDKNSEEAVRKLHTDPKFIEAWKRENEESKRKREEYEKWKKEQDERFKNIHPVCWPKSNRNGINWAKSFGASTMAGFPIYSR